MSENPVPNEEKIRSLDFTGVSVAGLTIAGVVLQNGTTPLTANWNAGPFRITSQNSVNVFNVTAAPWNADPTGVADSRAGIVAAIAALQAAGGGVLYFPQGTFRVVQIGAAVPLVITAGNVWIQGAGRTATNISFEPATGGACIQFNTSANPINYNQITDISFRSPNTTTQKTMILARDLNNFIVARVSNTAGTAWTGGAGIGSIGVHFQGRQEMRLRDCEIGADQPIFIDNNPNFPSISFDHSSIESSDFLATGLLSAPSTYHNPAIRIADGTVLTNSEFKRIAAVGGNGMIFMNNTTGPVAHQGVIIEDFRGEQTDVSGGHTTEFSIDLRANQAIQNLRIVNVQPDGTMHGIRLTNAKLPHVCGLNYGGGVGRTSLDLAATVNDFLLQNSFLQAGSIITDASVNPVALGVVFAANPPFSNFGSLANSGTVFSSVFQANTESTLTLVTGDNNNVVVVSGWNFVNGPAGAFAITGIAGGAAGKEVVIINNTSNAFTVRNASASSAVGNRINMKEAADTLLGNAFSWMKVKYFGALGAWVLVGRSA